MQQPALALCFTKHSACLVAEMGQTSWFILIYVGILISHWPHVRSIRDIQMARCDPWMLKSAFTYGPHEEDHDHNLLLHTYLIKLLPHWAASMWFKGADLKMTSSAIQKMKSTFRKVFVSVLRMMSAVWGVLCLAPVTKQGPADESQDAVV